MLNSAGLAKALIYSNECSTPLIVDGHVWSVPKSLPAELDFFSLDLYYGRCIDLGSKPSCHPYNIDPMMEVNAVKAFVDAYIRPRLRPHQRMMLVPGLFGDRMTNRSDTLNEQDTFLVGKLNGFYQLAKPDPGVVGLIPWHWLSPPATYGIFPTIFGLGIEAFPKLINRLNETGNEVRGTAASTRPL